MSCDHKLSTPTPPQLWSALGVGTCLPSHPYAVHCSKLNKNSLDRGIFFLQFFYVHHGQKGNKLRKALESCFSSKWKFWSSWSSHVTETRDHYKNTNSFNCSFSQNRLQSHCSLVLDALRNILSSTLSCIHISPKWDHIMLGQGLKCYKSHRRETLICYSCCQVWKQTQHSWAGWCCCRQECHARAKRQAYFRASSFPFSPHALPPWKDYDLWECHSDSPSCFKWCKDCLVYATFYAAYFWRKPGKYVRR